MIRWFRQRRARRDLARIKAVTMAANAGFTTNRRRQLSPARLTHIAGLVAGIVKQGESI